MPSATDPKDLKMVLNPARRKALTSLIADIISHMRTKIETSFDSPSQEEAAAPLFDGQKYARDQSSTPSPAPSVSEKRLEARLERSLSNSGLHDLKKDALFYFDRWAAEVKGQYRSECSLDHDEKHELIAVQKPVMVRRIHDRIKDEEVRIQDDIKYPCLTRH